MKKLFSIILILVIAVGLFTGCGNKQEKESKKESSEKKVTIKWLHHFGEEGRREWIENLITEFEKQNPNIDVEVEATSFDKYMTMLKTKIASDDAPDIFDFNNKLDLKDFIDNGYITDLTNELFMQNVTSAGQDSGRFGDKLFALALDSNAYGVFYNKEVFEKAGIKEIPQTYSKFIETCEILEEAGFIPIGAGFKESWAMFSDYYTDYMPDIFGDHPNWIQEKMNEKWIDDDAGLREALKRLYERTRYANSDLFGTDWNKATELVATGKAAMVLGGSWAIDTLKAKNPDLNVGAFAMPASEDPKDAEMPIGQTGGFVVYDKSPNKEAALKLLAFMTTQEMAADYQEKARTISTIKGMTADFEPALNDILEIEKKGQTFNASSVARSFSAEYQKAYTDNLTKFLMNDEMDINKFLRDMDDSFKKISNSQK